VNSQLYLDEMVKLLVDVFGVQYTRYQIRFALKTAGFTLKAIELHAKEQDEKMRAKFREHMKMLYATVEFTVTMGLFVDETHSDLATARRKYGWALKGRPAFKRVYNFQGDGANGCSAICSFSIEGFRTVTTYDVAVDTEVFMTTLQQRILPYMNPYPGPRSVLFLDNARVDRRGLCRIRRFRHLPSSLLLRLQPIEEGFHMGKAKLCRDVVDEDPHLSLQEHLRAELLTCCGSNEACNIFVHCGFPVTDEERDWAEYYGKLLVEL
jgi:hypothetical protein